MSKYQTTCIIVSKTSESKLYNYCEEQCTASKLLKNATKFRCRQLLFAHEKKYQNLLDHQLKIIEEFDTYTTDIYKKIGNDNYLPSANQFQKMYERTKNSDYYNPNLSAQTSIQIIRKVLNEFKGYFSAIKDYWKNPSKYTGKPKLLNYIKSDKSTATYTNQDCSIYYIDNKTYLKLLNMKENTNKKTRPHKHGYIYLGNLKIDYLMQVEIQPYYDTYKLCITYLKEEPNFNLNNNRVLGVDPGLNNFLTTSNNCGLHPFHEHTKCVNGNAI